MTRRVRSVVPPSHSTSPIYCSCHQPGSPPPLCSASCHPDNHAQASEVIWSHHPLRFRWGLYTCPQRWHRRPAEGVETNSRSSSTDVSSYRRAGPQTTASWAVVGPAQSVRPRSVARHCGNGDAPGGVCHIWWWWWWLTKSTLFWVQESGWQSRLPSLKQLCSIYFVFSKYF